MIARGHITLTVCGAVLWLVGFLMAAGLVYPWAFAGVYVGPPLLILGSVGWLQHYKERHGRLPNPVKSYREMLAVEGGYISRQLAMFQFMLKNLGVVTVLVLHFMVLLTYLGVFVFKRSEAYKAAKEFVIRDEALAERIGKIQGFGFLVGGTLTSSGSSDVTFAVIGTHETVEAKAWTEWDDGIQLVKRVAYRSIR